MKLLPNPEQEVLLQGFRCKVVLMVLAEQQLRLVGKLIYIFLLHLKRRKMNYRLTPWFFVNGVYFISCLKQKMDWKWFSLWNNNLFLVWKQNSRCFLRGNFIDAISFERTKWRKPRCQKTKDDPKKINCISCKKRILWTNTSSIEGKKFLKVIQEIYSYRKHELFLM